MSLCPHDRESPELVSAQESGAVFGGYPQKIVNGWCMPGACRGMPARCLIGPRVVWAGDAN